MIYYETTTDDFLQTLFNLEELICLSVILKQKINLKTSDKVKEIFNLENFNLIDELPENLSKVSISDSVCMYNWDVDDFDGSEFLFYLSEQKGALLRMDIFQKLDCQLIINKINFYESKYYFGEKDTYLNALTTALNFDIKQELYSKFSYFSQIVRPLPLLCLDKVDLTKTYSFDFKECYYISSNKEVNSFFVNNNISGYDLKDFLYTYNVKHQEYDINLLVYLCKDIFSEIYGAFFDDVFNSFLKMKYKKDYDYNPKILDDLKIASVINYQLIDSRTQAAYSWVRNNINCDRNKLLNLIRFRECVKPIV